MAVIPKYGDWVTFPLEQQSAVEIEWWSEKTQQRARYYVDKCWFGNRVDSRDDPLAYAKGLKPKGETVIFIAAEYIESRMQGAPHLYNLHLADRMRGKYNNDDPASRWALLQLNDMFHYGQNYNQSFRWIVYHPPAIAGRERKMYQHRFVDNVALVIADIGIELAGIAVNGAAQAASSGNVQVKGVVPILSRIKDFFAANRGHNLHQFSATAESLSPAPVQQQQQQQQTQDPAPVTLANVTKAVIQIIPSELPAVDYNEKNGIIIQDITIEDITYESQPRTDVSYPKRQESALSMPRGIDDIPRRGQRWRLNTQKLNAPIRVDPCPRTPKAQSS